MDARDVDLTVTRMRRPRRATAAAGRFPTQGSAALAVADLPGSADTAGVPARARRREPAHLAVAPPPPVTVPRAPFVVLVLLVVIGGVLGILLLNTKVNENAFILHDLRQEQAVLDQRQQELEEAVAAADSPARLEEAARRMGLVRAERLAYLRLPEGVVVFEPQPVADPAVADAGAEAAPDPAQVGGDGSDEPGSSEG